ncbi:probable serine/threonine-protein kinase PIX13 [Rhododendron vialii]|uniref:probable serine/threonine-protein kinase PIX13 n=1 Tax=Rhododendron vialii TaxID=182163 RepID=UPI00265FD3EE|nr:probable serine/threonine-protein kinase PIX13 [Rhododendron vialii]
MGNCLASPVENHSPIATQPSTSVDGKEKAIKQSKSSDNRHGAENRGSAAAGGGGTVVPPSGRIITPNLKNFTYAELQSATRNFRPEAVVGEGGFGTVFKGWVDRETLAPSKPGVGMPVAIKISKLDSWQGLQEWKAEVDLLGKFSHPNLVQLLGYCREEKYFILIYEYMEGGSLETHLFRKGGDPIPWDTRLNIAIGTAQGLTFLHTSEDQVIFRDFKASNILLDKDFNAKLSDFGVARLGPADNKSHVSTRIIGSYGYADPEYIATGHLYVKSDVYGFGVMLLELLTGLRVVDVRRPNGALNLIEWAKPSLAEKRKLKKIMDPRLENQYPPRAAFQAAKLVLKCLKLQQKHRPSMEEVLVTLQQINSIMVNPN